MTKFIDVSNDTKEVKKETVFTHRLNTDKGWQITTLNVGGFKVVKYLGNCSIDGDLFLVQDGSTLDIYKGTKGDEFNQ